MWKNDLESIVNHEPCVMREPKKSFIDDQLSLSVIIPVYNEHENICKMLQELYNAIQNVNHEILICCDFDADSTFPDNNS